MQGFNCKIMKILHDKISKFLRENIRVELVFFVVFEEVNRID